MKMFDQQLLSVWVGFILAILWVGWVHSSVGWVGLDR